MWSSRVGLVFLILLACGLAHAGLPGRYEGWFVFDGKTSPHDADSERFGPRTAIVLNSDGTFSEFMENHVMTTIVEHSTGTYKLVGSEVAFSGIETSFFDDGYRKINRRQPYVRTMRYEGGGLILFNDAKSGIFYLPKGSTPPSHLPSMPPRPSDPAALKILHEVEQRYAALSSYKDDAEYESLGSSYVPTKARISIRFSRPRLLFEITRLDRSKPAVMTAIWSDGKRSWLYKRDYNDGPPEERQLAMSYPTVEAGEDSVLVLRLLTKEPITTTREGIQVLLKPDETIAGKPCFTVCFRRVSGSDGILWIEKATHLMLRTYNFGSGIGIRYHPQVNVSIPSPQFIFRSPH